VRKNVLTLPLVFVRRKAFLFAVVYAIAYLWPALALANTDIDSNAKYQVADIKIEGNKVTKPFIIFRECSFKVGDSLPMTNLDALLVRNEQRIMNTQLFISVKISVDSFAKGLVYLRIVVRENWYIFPVPFVRLNDRNIAEWRERGAKLSRINYGVYLDHTNLLGMRQKGLIYVDVGLNTRVLVRYQNPHLYGNKNNGLFAEVRGLSYRGIAVNTDNNKLQFVGTDKTMLQLLDGKVRWRRRSGYYRVHFIELGFSTQKGSDTLSKLNPYYFSYGKDKQRYTTIAYAYRHDNRDNVNYSLSGAALLAEVRQVGVLPSDDVHFLQLRVLAAKYIPLGKNWYINGIAKGKIQSTDNVPYNLQRGLGYEEDFLRGYELYVANGTRYASARINLKRQLVVRELRFNKARISQLKVIPYGIYICAFADAGYVYQKYTDRLDNNLANTFMYSQGISLETYTINNVTAKFNLSRNAFNEYRLTINLQKDISSIWN
jgi:outer membrane protein assembly factor BamA